MLSNITGSPKTTIIGVLAGLFGLASALGHVAGIPANVATVCCLVATFAAVALGLFGVDPGTLAASASAKKGGGAS